ncbi:lipoyl synthase [Oligoflexia bacterium]|nr:lipoyl synthase [Oligoflexia bacterium]
MNNETLIRISRSRKPSWLKVPPPGSGQYLETRNLIKDLKLHTVCEEAMCPNIGECWSQKTATFIIMGEFCTRSCHFCSVALASPETLKAVDPHEPRRVAQAVHKLGLRHAVITSVTRDDLPDGGASHFAETVREIKKLAPRCSVELLIPDLKGSREHLEVILKARINILNHNIETVPRLYIRVRPQAKYLRSLAVLDMAKQVDKNLSTKSGMMVGLGETYDEVLAVMDDMRSAHVDILTIGQYLRPNASYLAVERYVTPEEFEQYREVGLKKGFRFVESGPFVRSSYHAWKHASGE